MASITRYFWVYEQQRYHYPVFCTGKAYNLERGWGHVLNRGLRLKQDPVRKVASRKVNPDEPLWALVEQVEAHKHFPGAMVCGTCSPNSLKLDDGSAAQRVCNPCASF